MGVLVKRQCMRVWGKVCVYTAVMFLCAILGLHIQLQRFKRNIFFSFATCFFFGADPGPVFPLSMQC